VRGASGQSSLEYLAVVLLAAVALAAGGALAASPGIAHAVVAQLARGICVVRGGDCERDRAPCVTATRTRTTDKRVRIAFLTLGGGRTLIRERRSDGTELVTDVERLAGGAEAGVGAEAGIGAHGLAAIVTGTVEGRLGHGRAWLLPSSAAADRLIARLEALTPAARARLHATGRGPAPAPPPDVVYTEHGLGSAAEAALGVLGLRYETEDLMGVRRDGRTGERTFGVRRHNTAAATLSLFAGQGGQASAQVEQDYSVTVDGSGRPVDLAIVEQRRLAAGIKPPGRVGSLLAAAGGPVVPPGHGTLVQAERHLDLTDPENLAVAAAFLRAVQHPHLRVGDAIVVSRALDRRLGAAGSEQARLYSLDIAQRGVHGRVALGVQLGGAATSSVETLRLVRASARAPLGAWEPRVDCVAVVGA
jgi:hypothetical protein